MRKLLVAVLALTLLSGCSFIKRGEFTYINLGRKLDITAKTPDGYEISIRAGVDPGAVEVVKQAL